MAVSPKVEEVNELDELNLDNSIVLNRKLMPAEGRDIDLKVKMLSKYIKKGKIFIPSKKQPELDDSALTNILTNLMIADEKGKVLAYHRNITKYNLTHKKYGYPYYTYDRYIKIINALINSRFVFNKNGFYDKLSGEGKISRMKLTNKLKTILNSNSKSLTAMNLDYFCINEIGEIRYIADNSLLRTTSKLPLISVVLKDKKKKPVDYQISAKVMWMIKQLDTYNKFIDKSLIVLPIEASYINSNKDRPPISIEVTDLSKVKERYPLPTSRREDIVKSFRSLMAFNFDLPPVTYPAGIQTGNLDQKKQVKHSRRKGRLINKEPLVEHTASSMNAGEVMNSINIRNWFEIQPKQHLTNTTKDFGSTNDNIEVTFEQIQTMYITIPPTNKYNTGAPDTITNRNSSAKVTKLFICKPLRCQLYRVFNNSSFKYGGRFYGAEYQGLNSEERRSILINGLPVVEADYSSFHTRMLYHLEGIDYNKDPYDLFAGDKYLRKAVKSLLNIAINAPNKTKSLFAFNDGLYPKNVDGHNNSVNHIIVEALKKKKLSASNFYDIIYEAHPAIQKYIGTGYGITLQRYDSEIAAKVLTYFTKKAIPCLCVHDSFIVQKQYCDELVEVMKRYYREMFKFDPIVDFK